MNSETFYVRAEFKDGFCVHDLCRKPMQHQYWNGQLVQNACNLCSAMAIAAAERPYFVRLEHDWMVEQEKRKKLLPGGEYF